MMKRPTNRLRALAMPLVLAAIISLPASTTALSIAASDMELEPERPVDGPATPSVWDTPAPIQVRPPAPKPAPPPRPLAANPLWAIPLATLSNTQERPIFSPSRRPPPVETPVAVVNAPPPPPPPPRVERPSLSLVGTISGDDESFGIFVDRNTSTALRLKLGEDYQGWRLRKVRNRDVALEHDRQTVVLSLPEPGAEGTAATPVAGMPPMPIPTMGAPLSVRPPPVPMLPANSTANEEQAPSLPGRRR